MNCCPECGSHLVWDYQKGEVTCPSCGRVVDRIYYDGPVRESESEEVWRNIRIRRNPRINKLYVSYKHHARMYRRVESYVRGKPWLEVDYDKVFETGKLVNSIKSRATIEAERKIESKNLWGLIERGLKFISEVNPAVLARSGRGKYALAYIVSTHLNEKRFPAAREVIETFNVSETSYRRLLKIAREILLVKNIAAVQ